MEVKCILEMQVSPVWLQVVSPVCMQPHWRGVHQLWGYFLALSDPDDLSDVSCMVQK